ncbi:GNAT family N-acetyltransferase [Jeotgalibacillus proteolyticus]|uniref:GNAT family N-acetyltransferase n=1 Tax=Jeotgalibacillus proteolyticus TaxID=2082395 RepID=A0A2S5GAD0_9BACL|nr:GNAT family N-acetyltransferase [Jeotgalibacillus proteolyticus]PPA69962.1 GNAT family N-acetyltransferase [Jeotgalibacillus proteolyticus]
MEKVCLIKPSENIKEQYVDYYEEWLESGESIIPHSTTYEPYNFAELLQKFENDEAGIGLIEGWVTSSTFLLTGEYGRIIGAVHIRHELTEDLTNRGGHIGYGIRPSERKKGFATKLLALALAEAKILGISKALVVCDADNTASEKTIQKNNGIPTSDFVEEDGNVIKRYWISTDGSR